MTEFGNLRVANTTPRSRGCACSARREPAPCVLRQKRMMSFKALSFRKIAALIALSGTVFWIYTFHAIANVPPGDHAVFRMLATFVLGAIFLLFFAPAWLLVAIGRLPRFTTGLGIAGLIAFAVVWMQVLQEFPKS
jgi:hypothetical protein